MTDSKKVELVDRDELVAFDRIAHWFPGKTAKQVARLSENGYFVRGLRLSPRGAMLYPLRAATAWAMAKYGQVGLTPPPLDHRVPAPPEAAYPGLPVLTIDDADNFETAVAKRRR